MLSTKRTNTTKKHHFNGSYISKFLLIPMYIYTTLATRRGLQIWPTQHKPAAQYKLIYQYPQFALLNAYINL